LSVAAFFRSLLSFPPHDQEVEVLPWEERQVRVLLRRDGEDLGAESEIGLGCEEEVGEAVDGLRMGASGCGVEAEMGTGRGVVAPEERAARDSFVEEAEEEFCEEEEEDEE
jgi:hypothetical protein